MKTSVCICGEHLERGYSGGRYHAWLLGEALAAGGACVTLWTNCVPEYASDFTGCPGHSSIRLHVDAAFGETPRERFEWVVIVPDQDSSVVVYWAWLLLAMRSNARVALINFETPNWFNQLAGFRLDEALWDNCQFVSRFCTAIISSARESTKYAKRFYTDVLQDCDFVSCSPCINSVVADKVRDVERRRQILVITRLGGWHHKHKGAGDLVAAIDENMRGCELVALTGNQPPDEQCAHELTVRAERHGVKVRFECGVNDVAKFTEIKQSALLLFLSRFEGFGYPPIEALYCGTPCVAYDLPVLRETAGDGILYVVPGDIDGVRRAVASVLERTPPWRENLREYVSDIATFDSFVERVRSVFDVDATTASVWGQSWACDQALQWAEMARHEKRMTLKRFIRGTVRRCRDICLPVRGPRNAE